MKNKKIIGILIVVSVLAGFFFIQGRQSSHSSRQGPGATPGAEEDVIKYWTCPMHPQINKDGPGQCPICSMNLIPVYNSDEGKIIVNEHSREYLGIRSAPVEYRHLIKEVRLPGKVSHDYALYTLQQEYLSVLAGLNIFKDSLSPEIYERQKVFLEAVKLRLKLLGFSDEQIALLEESKAPDQSLIYPAANKAWVQADIYEQDLKFVKPGQKVTIKVGGYEQELIGEIHSIEDVLNPQTRSAKARIVIPDPGSHLKHEAFADLTLEVDLGERPSVPRRSVIDTGTRKVVYVDTGEGRYQVRLIETGVEAQGFVEITGGVNPGEEVVTDGNFLLDSQSTLTGGQSLLYSGSEEINNLPQKQQPHRH